MEVKWFVESMECFPSLEGRSNVVSSVTWRATATDGALSSTNYGKHNIPYENIELFTEFSDLTQEQVLGWLKAAMGDEIVAAIESGLAINISEQKPPSAVTPALPW